VNCNIITSMIKYFYLNDIGMTPITEESEKITIMVWLKLIQSLDSTTSTMSLFVSSNTNKFFTYTPFFLEMIIQKLIDYS
jgi:hypothetical protein